MACIIQILINVSLILCSVNAKFSTRFASKTLAHLPGNQFQIDELVMNICMDLEFILEDKISATKCAEHFQNPEKKTSHRIGVKVLCRSNGHLHFEVEPSDSLQLVVLIPDDEEDVFINYSIIEPKIRFSSISVFSPSKRYIIFSTVLNKSGRPSLWQGEVRVPALSNHSVPEHRDYYVKVEFINQTRDERTLTGVVTWNQTGDADVCFEFMNNCKNGRFRKKIWPDTGPRVVIEDLPSGEACSIQVVGMYGTTKINYQTPTQLVSINQVKETEDKKNASESLELPQNISLVAMRNEDSWRVRVSWGKPRHPPDWYNVTLRAEQIQTIVLPGNATEAIFTEVTGEGMYNASVNAVKGNYTAYTFRRALFPGNEEWAWAGAAGGAWGALALTALALALCWHRLRFTLRNNNTKGLEVKNLEEGCLEPLESEDQWEIKFERLQLHEVIGEGAFGVVRRGILAPTEKEVAVKMLKEFPSVEEVRSFRLEMELMKSVGAHPHVVSLVGCCSSQRPLIVAEYCARGDLLSFLRCSWDVMVSRRNAKYYNNNTDAFDYRNDLFKCKIQRKNAGLAVNKMYDLQGLCDTDLTSLDLLSFCRQIAMGMEFLALNRLVHRDLAARNVLVTGDKTLKIADFGLSRDVYEENQYTQKGNGKMPVKWMALESLTRRIYTSQSDVWSFGVVMWEVVTVGGAPYAEVPAERLPRLLRAGYRMPRPHNCTKQLYELMQSCWHALPRERPTFTELHQRLDELLNSACAEEYLCLELDEEPEPTPTPTPTPRAHRYFKMILRGKRAWTRESYERPLKVHQGNYNHYTSPPFSLNKIPV